MKNSTERGGVAQNKETQPQAKNKPDPGLMNLIALHKGSGWPVPLNQCQSLLCHHGWGNGELGFFSPPSSPLFPPLTPFPHHKQSPNKAPIPTASPAPCSQQKRDAKPRLESDSPALNAALPAKCDLKAPLSQLQSSEQPFLG